MNKDIVLNTLFFYFMSLTFMDVFLTQYIIFFMNGIEVNVVMAELMVILGYLWWIPKVVVSYVIGKLLVFLKKENILCGLVFFMSIVCGTNVYYILKALV